MLKNYKNFFSILFLISSSLFLSGCASKFTNVSPQLPAKYEKLGQVTGTGSGSIGFLSTAYNVFPLGLNSRTERAYEDALSKAPGATGLMDVSYQESWFWWIIGTNRTVTISGEAIKEIK
jgi:hypothetical protein